MVENPFVFQIVGYQNSGKTTVVKKIIAQLAANNYKVATIKHHGHGGKPDIVESKDSSQHISAGAHASLVEGDGSILLQLEKERWSLDEQIGILSHLQSDFILIEGHKFANYPKVVILRNLEDQALLASLKNIQLVLYWQEEIVDIYKTSNSPPYFNINEKAGYDWTYNYLISQIK